MYNSVITNYTVYMGPFLPNVFISLEENTEHTLKEFAETAVLEMQLVYLKAGPPFRGTETI